MDTQGKGNRAGSAGGPAADPEVLDLIRARRSVRAHTPEPVPPALMDELLEAARWAPTGGNRQRWSFVAVQNPQRIRKLAAVSPGLLGRPAALIVICVETAAPGERAQPLDEACSLIETGMAAQNIMLLATARGLGSCPVLSFHSDAVARLLKLPPHLKPELVVTLGYAAGPARPPARRPLQELVHREQFGGPEGPLPGAEAGR